jgi:drug/metabolite transporter (DMT)-like permease
MSGLALTIVFIAAFLHATWNTMAKRSRKKIVFVWWFLLFALIFYLPMFLYYWPITPVDHVGWACILASGVIHFFYFLFLGGAYERGDLSLVYPISRGSGPLFVPLLAVIFIQEQLELIGVVGILLIILGIYVIHLQAFSWHAALVPLKTMGGDSFFWSFGTGLTIAVYSLVDKIGVDHVFPPVFIYCMLIVCWLILTPYVFIRERSHIRPEWTANKYTILLVGFLVLFTYMSVLFAMRLSKVSYVVAVREVSIVFSALYGVFLFGEKYLSQKVAGSALIACGVVCIGFG